MVLLSLSSAKQMLQSRISFRSSSRRKRKQNHDTNTNSDIEGLENSLTIRTCSFVETLSQQSDDDDDDDDGGGGCRRHENTAADDSPSDCSCISSSVASIRGVNQSKCVQFDIENNIVIPCCSHTTMVDDSLSSQTSPKVEATIEEGEEDRIVQSNDGTTFFSSCCHSTSWLLPAEYEEIEGSAGKILLHLIHQQKQSTELSSRPDLHNNMEVDEDNYCIRGLEDYLSSSAKENEKQKSIYRQTIVKLYKDYKWNTILNEHQQQRQEGPTASNDTTSIGTSIHEQIRYCSVQFSSRHTSEAISRATIDELEAMGIYKSEKLWW